MRRHRALQNTGEEVVMQAIMLRGWHLGQRQPKLMFAAIVRVLRSATAGNDSSGSLRLPFQRTRTTRVQRYHEVWASWDEASEPQLFALLPRKPHGAETSAGRTGSLRDLLSRAGWHPAIPIAVLDDPFLDSHSIDWLGNDASCAVLVPDPNRTVGRDAPNAPPAIPGLHPKFRPVQILGFWCLAAGTSPEGLAIPLRMALAQAGEWCRSRALKAYSPGKISYHRWETFLQYCVVHSLLLETPRPASQLPHTPLSHQRLWLGGRSPWLVDADKERWKDERRQSAPHSHAAVGFDWAECRDMCTAEDWGLFT